MKKGFLTKVISGLLIAAQIGVMPVQAYTVEKNMLTDENGYLVKYTDALDFNSKGIFSAFDFNIGCDEDIFAARKGLTSEDMLNIILCNAPSYFLERGYRYRVNKYENDVYGVVVFESYAGKKIPEVSEKLGSIVSSIKGNTIDDVYNWVYDNIPYSSSSTASAYDVLCKGESANAQVLVEITGNILVRKGIIHNSMCVLNGNKRHYIITDGYKVIYDIVKDKENGTKGEALKGNDTLLNTKYRIGYLYALI